MDRRTFLKTAAAAGMATVALAGAGCASGAASAGSSKQDSSRANASANSAASASSSSQSASEPSSAAVPAVPTVRLSSGFDMPVFGIGTWTLSSDVAEASVYSALASGYRLVDTARYYHNEDGVGRAVRRAIEEGIATRSEIFVTSKILTSSYDAAAQAIDDSLSALGLDYIDLMLIHQPGSNDAAEYAAMEQAVADGKARSLGISNYYTPAAVDEVMSFATIPPVLVQNENHVFNQGTALRDYVSKYDMHVESWYPLCGRGNTADCLDNDVIKQIAAAHNATSAQVIARWHAQAGFIVIPGSSNPDHITENIGAFGFELTDAEMSEIAALDRQHRYEPW